MKILSPVLFLLLITTLIAFRVSATITTTISVNGIILPETCDINTDNLNQAIDLGEYSVTDFQEAGSETTKVQFSLELEKCTAGINAAKIIFNGKPMALNLNIFDLGSEDIGLELLDSLGAPIVPGAEKLFVLSKENKNISFSMRLKSASSSVTPGHLSATIVMDIEYE